VFDVILLKKLVKNFLGKFKRNPKLSARDKYATIHITTNGSKDISKF